MRCSRSTQSGLPQAAVQRARRPPPAACGCRSAHQPAAGVVERVGIHHVAPAAVSARDAARRGCAAASGGATIITGPSAGDASRRGVERRPQPAIEDHARQRPLPDDVAHRQPRIVGEHGADCRRRWHRRPRAAAACAGARPSARRSPCAITAARRQSSPSRADRRLDDDQRPPALVRREKAGVEPPRRPASPRRRRRSTPAARSTRDAARPRPGGRVERGDHHAGDAGIENAAAVHGPVRPVWQHGSSVTYIVAPRGPRAGRLERDHLGVRPAGALVEALADDRPRRRRRRPRRRRDSASSRPAARAAWNSARRIMRQVVHHDRP